MRTRGSSSSHSLSHLIGCFTFNQGGHKRQDSQGGKRTNERPSDESALGMRARRLQGGQDIGEIAFLFNTSYRSPQGVPAKRSVPWSQARYGTLVLLPMAARLLSDDDLAHVGRARERRGIGKM
jgi:hypothetical protein